MRDRIVLNKLEQRRVDVLNHLASAALVNSQAARLLGISVRQLQRLHRAYLEQGVAGLAHGNRGRPAENAVDSQTVARIVELARTTYQLFNHQHLTEMLVENHAIALSRPTVRTKFSRWRGAVRLWNTPADELHPRVSARLSLRRGDLGAPDRRRQHKQ